jgi:hypothetical protein
MEIVDENKKSGELTIDALAQDADKPMMELTTVFPFDFFPTTISVYERKVVINNQLFFWSNHMTPFPVEQIRTVQVTKTLIFASMVFDVRDFGENPPVVNFLWAREAERAQKLILGLKTILQSGLNPSEYPLETLVKRAEMIGTI